MNSERATSFGSHARIYHDSRPTYPVEAVRWVVDPLVRYASAPRKVGSSGQANSLPVANQNEIKVVDLAAGTGKLTAVLAAEGYSVVAVEPDTQMSALIAADLPHVQVLEGRDTNIPLADESADAVFVAQAWHWFDPVAAASEIARVLKPGGSLAIIWNVYDESVPWVAQLQSLLRHGDPRDAARVGPQINWAQGEFKAFPWSWERTPEQVVRLALSTSWFISLPDRERKALAAKVRDLLEEQSDSETGLVTLPYLSEVHRFSRPQKP